MEPGQKKRNLAEKFIQSQVKPGQVLNPKGRPKGSISVMARVRELFRDDPEAFDLWIRQYVMNPRNQKHIVEMLDGKPKQQNSPDNVFVLPFQINISQIEDNKKMEIEQGQVIEDERDRENTREGNLLTGGESSAEED